MPVAAPNDPRIAPLAAMKNIGVKSAGWMIEVGVDSPEKLEELGAVETYLRMKAAYPRHVSKCALWALAGALEGVPYNRLDIDAKQALDTALSAAIAERTKEQ